MSEFGFKELAPDFIRSKLPFDDKKCPLILSENGNLKSLFLYSHAGPFVDLFDPRAENLLPALKFAIMNGRFCNFNFADIKELSSLSSMLDRLKEKCSTIHKDLYGHIINNTLMKQSFDSLMSLIPFDPVKELNEEIYETNKENVRMIFFVQIDNLSSIKTQTNDKNLSLFNCMFIKP